jgi:hypothetical protein
VSLAASRDKLTDAFQRMPQLARDLEQPPPVSRELAALRRAGGPEPLVWSLALDELQATGVDLRPRLPLRGERNLTGPTRVAARAAAPLSTVLKPLALDPLTVADDDTFLDRIGKQRNLPTFITRGLKQLY